MEESYYIFDKKQMTIMIRSHRPNARKKNTDPINNQGPIIYTEEQKKKKDDVLNVINKLKI